MNGDRFRALAVGLPEVEEKSHFGKADFRVRNKIFAGFTADGSTYVKLKVEQQDMLCAAMPLVVSPIKGAWGRQGWTVINASLADEGFLRSVLGLAWQNVAPKGAQI